MKMRRHYLERDTTLSNSQTKTIDLNGLDPISAIDIIYEATNGATSNQGNPLHKDVDAIEVVDGSDVLFSLNGPQILGLNCFETGKYPYSRILEGAAAVPKEKFTIHFGRFIGDPLLYLDPTAFSNPQLKCTHSLTISATAGFATGTGKITVIAHIFDERPPAPRGFLMTKDHYDWTTVASGDETIKLPTDYAYRMMLLRAYETGTAWTTDITKLKLSLDEDKKIPFDLYADDLVTLQEQWWGQREVWQRLFRTDADAPETFIADITDAHVNAVNDLDIASIDAITADTITLQLLSLTVVPAIAKSVADTRIEATVKGLLPHHCAAIPFGDYLDPDTWLKAQEYESIKAKVTQGGAGATASMILQQLRS